METPIKLTELEALQITSRMWKWLSENPRKYKDQWPEFKSNGGTVELLLNDCACCHFSRQKAGKEMNSLSAMDCVNCPLRAHWPDSCEDEDSDYLSWEDAVDDDERCIAAFSIHNAAEEAIKKLLAKA